MPMTRRAYERDLEERIAQVNDAPVQLRSNYDAQKSDNTKKVDRGRKIGRRRKIGLKSNLVILKCFWSRTKNCLNFISDNDN